jgi:hypothetical protein
MSDLPGFAAAQRSYEAQLPPDGGPVECPDCAAGLVDTSGFGDFDACDTCKGSGFVTADGEPHDPHQAEREAEEYADMKRDEQLTDNQPHEGDFE